MIIGRIEALRLASMATISSATDTCACSAAVSGTVMAECSSGRIAISITAMPMSHLRTALAGLWCSLLIRGTFRS